MLREMRTEETFKDSGDSRGQRNTTLVRIRTVSLLLDGHRLVAGETENAIKVQDQNNSR